MNADCTDRRTKRSEPGSTPRLWMACDVPDRMTGGERLAVALLCLTLPTSVCWCREVEGAAEGTGRQRDFGRNKISVVIHCPGKRGCGRPDSKCSLESQIQDERYRWLVVGLVGSSGASKSMSLPLCLERDGGILQTHLSLVASDCLCRNPTTERDSGGKIRRNLF